jgi:hypothetical protein
VSRQGGKPHPRRTKSAAAQGGDAATVSVLPMDIQIGDRFTDEEGEWEVVSHPCRDRLPKRSSGMENADRSQTTLT